MIANTSNSLPNSLASYAAGVRQTPITSASPRTVPRRARPATNSRSPFVVAIIATSTGVGTKPHGGGVPGSIRLLRLARYGSKAIHY